MVAPKPNVGVYEASHRVVCWYYHKFIGFPAAALPLTMHETITKAPFVRHMLVGRALAGESFTSVQNTIRVSVSVATAKPKSITYIQVLTY